MSKLKITALREGFRRAGRAWPTAGEIIDTKDFTREQIDALKSEPMLQVSEPKEEDLAKIDGATKAKK